MNDGKVSDIIFDLGNVIVNYDERLSINALSEHLDKENIPLLNDDHFQHLTESYGEGRVSTEDFRLLLKEYLKISHLTDNVFDEIWGHMVINIPPRNVSLLKKLKNLNYSIHILSNTNPLHVYKITDIFLSHDVSIDEIFTHKFFSHDIGYNKPDKRIFEHMLAVLNKPAHELLYFDDCIKNIKMAETFKIQTKHVLNANTLDVSWLV